MNWARVCAMPIVSSLECHRQGESSRGLPPYCVDRSPGQRKIPFTLMPRRMVVMGDNTLDIPPEPYRKFQQIIITKRSRDFLSNPKADRLFQCLSVHHFVVFGTVAEHCVKAMVLGLLARQHRVAVVTDACGCWSAGDAELAMRQMDAKGAVLVTTDELIAGTADERIAASRIDAVVEEETDVIGTVTAASGNGHTAEPVEAKSNGQKRNDADVAARSDEPLRRPARERLRPELRGRRRGAGIPQTRPPAGLA